MVTEELHTKGRPRKQEFNTFRTKRKAIYEEWKAENSAKTRNFSKRTPPRSNSNKKQKTNGKSLSTFLGPTKLKEYKEQGKCFHCGSKDHMKRDCPHLKGKEQKIEDGGAMPLSNDVPDVHGNTYMDPQKRQLLKAWGKLEGKNTLVLFDLGSTDNFISSEMAEALKLQASSMGVPIEASSTRRSHASYTNCGKAKDSNWRLS